MQIVYLSKRPQLFFETLQCVRRLIPFIGDVIVLVPESSVREFRNLATEPRLTILGEEEILDDDDFSRGGRDHQLLNYHLRAKLAFDDRIDDEFIMADDDSRPLRPLDESFFRSGGKHHSYYFGDLADWQHGLGSFDLGQQNTYALLSQRHLPHAAFASHMPQVIYRDLYREAVSEFATVASEFALCEWSTYFNYATATCPERFHRPSPFESLCWPETPLSWTATVEPERYSFENFTPSLYEARGPFASLTANAGSHTETELLKKVLLWRRYCLLKRRPELDPRLSEVRLALSPIERILVRPLRRLLRRLTVDDHFQLLKIRADVEQRSAGLRTLEKGGITPRDASEDGRKRG